jgi:hypothetical protein
MAEKKNLFPFELTSEATAGGVSDLVGAVIEESDRQVKEKNFQDEGQIDEFRMACDALNCWRMYLRFIEEMQQEALDEETQQIFRELCRRVAKRRKYSDDDFQSALLATHERTRLPWGFNSLRLAYGRAQRNPMRLLNPELDGAALPTLLAGIAHELAQMQRGNDPILMPVDSLRAMLGQRKLVVGGAIMRLMQAGLLEQTSKRHGTGRAREFRWKGVAGKDYVFLTESGSTSDEGD